MYIIVCTDAIRVDENEDRANRKKHGIPFEVAALAFDDPLAITFPERVIEDEQRWITLGAVYGELLLLIAHTVVEEPEEVTRIISARKATPQERKRYEEGA